MWRIRRNAILGHFGPGHTSQTSMRPVRPSARYRGADQTLPTERSSWCFLRGQPPVMSLTAEALARTTDEPTHFPKLYNQTIFIFK